MFAIMSVGGGLCFFDIFFAENFAVRTVPNRHLVPPPELARDAPGLNIAHPFEIGFLIRFRHKFHIAVLYGLNGFDGQLRRIDKPLVGKHRLNNDV